MRTTLDIPKELIDEAMSITRAKTKTELIHDFLIVSDYSMLLSLVTQLIQVL